MRSKIIRRYSELQELQTFEERYEYLRLFGRVGNETFGFERYLNQRFYTSVQWKQVRSRVIARDYGRDLGVEGCEIFDRVIIHHMNPMTVDDIHSDDDSILNEEFLITTSHRTHNAIHYGVEQNPILRFVERRPGDTKLWG